MKKNKLPAEIKSIIPPLKIRWRDLPRAVTLWLFYKAVKTIIGWRNRPQKILLYPDERLARIAESVDFQKTTRKQRIKIIRKMGASLAQQKFGERLGIAAPQIGINLRVIIVRGNVMFNPEWKPVKGQKEYMIESCYSSPKKLYRVQRAKYGWAKWTNIDGKPFESKLKGIPAVVFQHELDHLKGVCCDNIGEKIK